MGTVAFSVPIACVAIATVATFAIEPWLAPSVSLLFFPAVLVSAIYFGFIPGLFAAILSTVALAYFIIPPAFSFSLGIDDMIRLVVFAAVAVTTASISAARRNAEDAQRRAVERLRTAVATLQKLTGWPVLVGTDLESGVRSILGHAAQVVGCSAVAVAWEADDEPWIYLGTCDPQRAVSTFGMDQMTPLVAEELQATTFFSTRLSATGPCDVSVSAPGLVSRWRGEPCHSRISTLFAEQNLASAPFVSEHLSGRAFFGGLSAGVQDAVPIVELVARELGSSLDQLHVAEQLKQVAVREDRIRLARDLHDGTLQALTGIRLELQAIVNDADSTLTPAVRGARLLAVERALSVEQRQLRLFIEDLTPTSRSRGAAFVDRLRMMCGRLSGEWKIPIAVTVEPTDLECPTAIEHALRLMVHEAVINGLKHAHPSHVAIEVTRALDGLRVVVSDDGQGFGFRGRLDHDTLVSANVGPASLRERVDAMGGRITIESQDIGSCVEITIPDEAIRPPRARSH